MVKLFIGNLPREATEQEIRSLFEQYGKVLECDIIKNYGFVHIEDKTAAEDAIRNLHHYKLHGVNINVEASKNKSKTSTKLHVGNISPTCTNKELRAKFEEYGPVIECDIVKDYAFVHMERAEDAVEAIRGLDNTEFQGMWSFSLRTVVLSKCYHLSRGKGQKREEKPDYISDSGGRPLVAVPDIGWDFSCAGSWTPAVLT
ncbi:RNA-binding protein 4 isoform 4-T6 [Hipposideros larvatus]